MRLTRRLVIVFVVATVIATVADTILILTGHQDRPLVGADFVDYWPAFAVVSDFAIIYGAKWLGALLIQRDHQEEQEEQEQDGDE
ncbi:MAG: hypothetical protein F4X64_05250 [Chloroflexi bacterium]|nr:hypothetical protein [Chloroflexota bacterium]